MEKLIEGTKNGLTLLGYILFLIIGFLLLILFFDSLDYWMSIDHTGLC